MRSIETASPNHQRLHMSDWGQRPSILDIRNITKLRSAVPLCTLRQLMQQLCCSLACAICGCWFSSTSMLLCLRRQHLYNMEREAVEPSHKSVMCNSITVDVSLAVLLL